jgi:hypothetical protein
MSISLWVVKTLAEKICVQNCSSRICSLRMKSFRNWRPVNEVCLCSTRTTTLWEIPLRRKSLLTYWSYRLFQKKWPAYFTDLQHGSSNFTNSNSLWTQNWSYLLTLHLVIVTFTWMSREEWGILLCSTKTRNFFSQTKRRYCLWILFCFTYFLWEWYCFIRTTGYSSEVILQWSTLHHNVKINCCKKMILFNQPI